MGNFIRKLPGLRAWAQVDLGAVIHNFDEAKAKIAPDMRLLAVVKADAYGHGATEVAHALESRADMFAVATAEEALELRQDGIKGDILILGYAPDDSFDDLIENDITPTVDTLEEAYELNDTAERFGRRAKAHIALDTGMSRIGFCANEEGIAQIKEVCALPNIDVRGIFSHFSTADEEDKSFSLIQKERFSSVCAALEAAGINIPIKHLSNSAGIVDLPPCFDMARAGIILYGLYPSDEVKHDMELIPALSLYAKVNFLKEIDEGTAVGYGRTFVANKKTRIATLCAGYADGIPRMIARDGYVLLCGKRAKIIGRVCMDQMMIDVTDIPDVKIGSVATIIGRDGKEEITADEFARWAGTISYEILCGISKRVPRLYDKTK